MVESREADAGGPRDVAHRGGVIALFRKDPCGGAQNQFQLLIVTRNDLHKIGQNGPLCAALWNLCVSVVRIRQNHSPQRHRGAQRLTEKTITNYNRTYSNSNGLPLIPVAGGAIQLAILPTSVTGCIRLRTYSRSSVVGSHSDLFGSNSAFVIRFPFRSKQCPAYSPTWR